MIKRRHSLKIVIIISALISSISLIALFIYRYQILQYSTEKIVRQYLPDYISIDKMIFNFKDSRIAFRSFKMLNPPGFSGKYLIDIGEVECRYAMKGKGIMEGLEVLQPVFKDVVLFIERRPDGTTNLQEMGRFLESKDRELRATKPTSSQVPGPAKAGGPAQSGNIGGKGAGERSLSSIVKLPEDFILKNGKVIFLDGMVRPGEYKITLESISATLHLKLNDAYTKALNIATTGSGILNGKSRGTIKWDTKLDPTAGALTMSNRFNVSGVDIMDFTPYYDKYSPLAVKSGYFSGVLIFDFDNGNIGSTNEIVLSKFSFNVKNGYENAQYLETNVPELVKYFTSSRGDIVFDFKLKGQMSNPQFYLGPISKQAIAAMAIGKITQALAESAMQQANPQRAGATGGSSDLEKAAEYIKIFKGMMKESN